MSRLPPSTSAGLQPLPAGFVRLQEMDLADFYGPFLRTYAEPIFIDLFRPMPCPTLAQFRDYFAPARRPIWTLGPAAAPQAYFALHHFQHEHALANLDFVFFAGCPEPGAVGAAQLRDAVDACLPEWGLTRLQSFVLADSAGKIRLLEWLGFRREGLLREHCFHHGRFHDVAVHAWMAEGRDG